MTGVPTLEEQEAAVTVVELDGVPALQAAAALFGRIWRVGDGPAPIGGDVLRALSHCGHFVAGAYDDASGRLVGASVGFLCPDRGAMHLHSHITGVEPAFQRRHIGLALKRYQREWSLDRGIDRIEWTFDPLVRRNGYFNLARLGARAVTYYADFYGPMADGINAGDESDRCLARWDVRDSTPAAESTEAQRVDALVLLDTDAGGWPVTMPPTDDGSTRLCWVPEDVTAWRSSDRTRAIAWRRALRAAMGVSLADGFVATDMSRDGWYVLERP